MRSPAEPHVTRLARCFPLVLLALAALTSLAGTPRALAGTKRPNFLFIYTDDQRWDAMSVVQREQGEKARFPWLRTPNMDRLAAEGVWFRNAFVVNALCAPSRATFLTGQYGHRNGVVNNHTPFPESSVTHASLMRAAGYRTGYVGKWHMGTQRGQRPGFDYSASFIGQGQYTDCPFEVNGERTETKGWVDDVSTEYALKFIRENRDRPFSLTVGFKTTHGPFQPPDRRKEEYAGEMARSVPNLAVPAIYSGKPAPAEKPPATVPTNLGYFRCITAADDDLGRLLQALDELKLADNTMVVLASDNGYYLGEHGLGDKRSAYEESMRIPLLVRYPKLQAKGRTVDEMALNVDLAPTFLDYAGVSSPREMHGRSLRPLLEGRAADWRRAFFYAYFYENNFRIPTVTAVRTARAKLTRYPGHEEWTELFDLERDPYETRNLIADPTAAALRKELEAEYERQKAAIDFRIPAFADNPDKEASGAPLKAWVLDYRFDKGAGDRIMDASGQNNHGTLRGAQVAEGRNGGKALRFDGKGSIEVPKSRSLNPAVAGWTVEAVFRADRPDGVVLACGGQTNGYCLHLEGGKPVFTVVSQNRATRVAAAQSVAGQWTRVTARITAGRELRLEIDGKPAGSARLPAFIAQEPRDGLTVGADLGSPVVSDPQPPAFTGLLESVRLYSGEAP